MLSFSVLLLKQGEAQKIERLMEVSNLLCAVLVISFIALFRIEFRKHCASVDNPQQWKGLYRTVTISFCGLFSVETHAREPVRIVSNMWR